VGEAPDGPADNEDGEEAMEPAVKGDWEEEQAERGPGQAMPKELGFAGEMGEFFVGEVEAFQEVLEVVELAGEGGGAVGVMFAGVIHGAGDGLGEEQFAGAGGNGSWKTRLATRKRSR
jgi:hypothetical protein